MRHAPSAFLEMYLTCFKICFRTEPMFHVKRTKRGGVPRPPKISMMKKKCTPLFKIGRHFALAYKLTTRPNFLFTRPNYF